MDSAGYLCRDGRIRRHPANASTLSTASNDSIGNACVGVWAVLTAWRVNGVSGVPAGGAFVVAIGALVPVVVLGE